MGNVTNQTVYEDLVYIDKHPQPSHDQDTMPAVMRHFYGSLQGTVSSSVIPRALQTGDVHTAAYDFGSKRAWLAIGQTDKNGTYGPNNEGMACNQPSIEF